MACTSRHGRWCSPYHERLMGEYWPARQHDEALMEYETRMFKAEVEEHKQKHDMITFKKWLVGGRSAHLNRPDDPEDPGEGDPG